MLKSTRRALALALVAGAATSSAHAQVIDWIGPSGAAWSIATNWNPTNVPDSGTEIARFNLGGIYSVTYNINASFGGINVIDPGARIDIPTGLTMGVASTSNNGQVVINSNNGGAGTVYRIDGTHTILGTGRITLNSTSNLDTAQFNTNVTTVTNGPGHTIDGRGRIRASLINNGLVEANVSGSTLELLSVSFANNATLRAVGGGNLQMTSLSVDQTGGGEIVADNASVSLVNCGINGGTVRSINGGAVGAFGGVTLTNVTHAAGTINLQTGNTVAYNGATFTNNGVVVVNSNSGGAGTVVRFDAPMTLAGAGDIVLQATSNLDTAQFSTNGVTITHGSQHDIRGTGRIRASMTNQGRIIADQAGKTLEILSVSMTNNRALRASDTGVLQINGITVTQGVNGRIDAINDGALSFLNCGITGGVIDSSDGSASIFGAVTWNSVADVIGNVAIPTGNSLVIRGAGLTHQGTITINSNVGGAGTVIRFDEDGVLAGSGIVELSANSNLDTAQLNTNLTTFTHAPGHTIKGTGRIRSNLINNGLILADRASGATLELLALPVTNNAQMRATNGGNLQVSGIVVTQGPTGLIASDAGSAVNLVNTQVSGGTLFSGGSIGMFGTVTLVSTALQAGPVNVPSGNSLLVRGTGLVNDGLISVNSNVGGAGTVFRFDDTGVLTGSGILDLRANGNLDTAQLNTGAGITMTNAAAHTISGTGRIRAAVTNDGLIRADRAGAILEILGTTISNNAAMRAENTGVLQVTSSTVNQGAAGVIETSGGPLNITNSTISDGQINASGGDGGIFGTVTLDSVDRLRGTLNVPSGNSLLIVNGLRNDGQININSNVGGAGTVVRFDSPGGFTGNGTLTLKHNGNPDTAQFNRNGTFVPENGPNHTIAGNGRFRTPLVNHGTLSPGLSVGTLEFLSSPLTMTPTSVYKCEVGGVGSHDKIVMNAVSPAVVDGLLRVELLGGFTPNPCDSFTIIDGVGGGSVSGKFREIVVVPPLPASRTFRLVYTSTDVILRLTCYADFNSDCELDIFDFLEFQNQYATGSPEACDCDTSSGNLVCDIFDFLCFQNAFAAGCP